MGDPATGRPSLFNVKMPEQMAGSTRRAVRLSGNGQPASFILGARATPKGASAHILQTVRGIGYVLKVA